MTISLKVAAFLALAIFLPTTANAQSIPIERLNDWEFRFYVCKNVIMNAAVVTRLMARYQVTDQSGISKMKSELGPALVKAVTENENVFQFREGEAWFVSDLTFSVVSGMVSGGFELSDLQLMRSANEICISTIESFAN